ncbi:MAG: adenylate/guanylate cyclase domain-containing protein [Bacteroidota bacterium]
MITPRSQLAIARIIPFCIIWSISSLVYTFLERGILGTLDYYPSTGNPYNFVNNLFITTAMASVTGLIIGSVEVFYLSRLLIKRSFVEKMLVKVLIYFTIIVAFLFGSSVAANAFQLNVSLTDRAVWKNAGLFLSTFSFWGVGIFISYGIVISLFFDEVSGSLGSGVLNNFFRGKYHKPIEEDRIFMFLDMQSSTKIAESMGHAKYFQMLKEYFADLTEPIIDYGGEIYQYVGDEIVISWKVVNGIGTNNCIECFLAMKLRLKNMEDKYIQAFGVLPKFKAGLHIGRVTTGEIGVIKREIIFTGDVLNTSARIQSLCNNYNVEILMSAQLFNSLERASLPAIRLIGEVELRGRDEKVFLYTL